MLRDHLEPFFGEKDVRDIGVAEVQAFHDRCLDTGKPRSARSIELALATLRLILSYARAQELVQGNPVEAWKRGGGNRRSRTSRQVDPEQVLTFAETQKLLSSAARLWPGSHPLILFLVDTGARFGEDTALRWSDVDLDAGTARICRSFSSGKRIGPTKTGRERRVELSRRLCQVLTHCGPDIFPDEELVFQNNAGSFVSPTNFRGRVWKKLVKKALGAARKPTPHALRHTFATLHMARGTNLKWLQAQGGWSSAKMLLDVYGHYLPTESQGFADALATAPDGTMRHQTEEAPGSARIKATGT